ncbi:MAG: ribosomal RNA small subunit methyltransferase A [Deltaproteobacteria bacterium]|nr:ribosomal RNA small subunit methyltransferase A [Deltaproteobacteria bacterium]
MNSPIKTLAKYGVRPRKKYGQNFLIDMNVIRRIVEAADLTERDTVVEIGAGIGVMTGMIADRAGKVVAVDVDPPMIEILREELKDRRNVEIIQADILRFDFAGVPKGNGRLIVMGNIPYNISTPILFRLFDFRRFITSMALMFQREVAERIVAPPGVKAYGILSVMSAFVAEPMKIISAPAACFTPRPNVDSMVVKLLFKKEAVSDGTYMLFNRIVRKAFGKRRKTVVNSLKDDNDLLSTGLSVPDILRMAGIDGRRRPESLSWKDFLRIATLVEMRQKA